MNNQGFSLVFIFKKLLPAEVGRDFAPLACFPLDDGNMYGVLTEPQLGTGDDVVEAGGVGVALQLSLAMLLLNPEDGIVRVAVDDLVRDTLFLHECQRMDDGQKLPDVIRAVEWSEVEDRGSCREIDTLVLHRAGVAGTGGVNGPRVGAYLWVQRQYGVVTVVGRVQHLRFAN